MNETEITTTVEQLIVNGEKTLLSNYTEFKNDSYKFLLFVDKDIWDMEVLEDYEICRGEFNLIKGCYFILDKIC
jgi:hypothetical protein